MFIKSPLTGRHHINTVGLGPSVCTVMPLPMTWFDFFAFGLDESFLLVGSSITPTLGQCRVRIGWGGIILVSGICSSTSLIQYCLTIATFCFLKRDVSVLVDWRARVMA